MGAMEVTIKKEALAKALTSCKPALGRDSEQPILACVLLAATPEGLRVEATDLEVRISHLATAEFAHLGMCVVEHKRLAAVVKGLPKKTDITLRCDQGIASSKALNIACNGLEVEIEGYHPADFPSAHNAAQGAEIHAGAFCEAIERVIFSVSKEAARVNLNGVLVESDGATVTTVSTDGHRLTRYRTGLAIPALERGVVVPLKAAKIFGKHRKAKAGRLCIGGTRITLTAGPTTVQAKLAPVTFPPYQQVIPSHLPLFRANTAALLAALEGVAVLAPAKTKTVVAEIEGSRIALIVDNPDQGKAQQSIAIEPANGPLEHMRIGFNADYVIQVLKSVGTPEVCVRANDALDPIVFEPVDGSDTTYVVMPMRV